MTGRQDSSAISLNARVGALAMGVSAPLNLFFHLQGPKLAPLSYLSWLGLSFGVLCFCDEMGGGKPLNRAGLVLFAATFWANTTATFAVDPNAVARAQLLYAFTGLGALLLWSAALMHRTETVRAVGAIGSLVGGGALILLIAAHLLLGATTILGFSQLFDALDQSRHATASALVVIDAVICVWCLTASLLLGKGWLRS